MRCFVNLAPVVGPPSLCLKSLENVTYLFLSLTITTAKILQKGTSISYILVAILVQILPRLWWLNNQTAALAMEPIPHWIPRGTFIPTPNRNDSLPRRSPCHYGNISQNIPLSENFFFQDIFYRDVCSGNLK